MFCVLVLFGKNSSLPQCTYHCTIALGIAVILSVCPAVCVAQSPRACMLVEQR